MASYPYGQVSCSGPCINVWALSRGPGPLFILSSFFPLYPRPFHAEVRLSKVLRERETKRASLSRSLTSLRTTREVFFFFFVCRVPSDVAYARLWGFGLDRSELDQIRTHSSGLLWGGVLCVDEASRAVVLSLSVRAWDKKQVSDSPSTYCDRLIRTISGRRCQK